MGLFDKKYCEFCGSKIGLLGNNKLEDGNMCNDCEKKLSNWFRDRRHTTVEDIRAQLVYREANAIDVARFHATRELGTEGGSKFFLLDESTGRFILLREGEDMKKNPDVFDLALVRDAHMDIVEEKIEDRYKNAEDKYVSYEPKHYSYKYKFVITVDYDSPYFRQLKFPISYSMVNGGIDGEKYRGETTAEMVGAQLLSKLGIGAAAKVSRVNEKGVRMDLPGGYRTDGLTTMKPKDIETYQEYEALGSEIVAILLGAKAREAAAAPAAPAAAPASVPAPEAPASAAWFCPECGTRNERNFCTACGTKRP